MRVWFLLFLLLGSSALADVEPREARVQAKGDGRYLIDVTVGNPSGNTARKPITVKLFIKAPEDKVWRQMAIWTDFVRDLPPHSAETRQFDSVLQGHQHAAFEKGKFEMRVEAMSANKKVSSKVFSYP
ncbi:MAG: hypothetical protein KC910_21315 [Candidatus Eremiobacteraeota bacterium]|nr:hypothetical protein [Candidatus Eremiobacteraeota bacterium]